MRVGIDAEVFDQVLAIARRPEFLAALEVISYASSMQVASEMHSGLDVEVFDHVLVLAKQGAFDEAIQLTGYASNSQVAHEMRSGLDAEVLRQAIDLGQRGFLANAIQLTSYASNATVRAEMHLHLDPIVLDFAIDAAEIGELPRAKDLTALASSRFAQEQMLAQIEGSRLHGPSTRRRRPVAPQLVDTTDPHARVKALMATASPEHRRLFGQYNLQTLVMLDELLENIELESMANGRRSTSQELVEGTIKILTENGYETTQASATHLAYALESARADLGLDPPGNPGMSI